MNAWGPSDPDWANNLAKTYMNRGDAFLADNRPAQAIAESDKALEILSNLQERSRLQSGDLLIRTETLRFCAWRSLNGWTAAARALISALEIATTLDEQWQGQNSAIPQPWNDVLTYLTSELHVLSSDDRGQLLAALGNKAEAIKQLLGWD